MQIKGFPVDLRPGGQLFDGDVGIVSFRHHLAEYFPDFPFVFYKAQILFWRLIHLVLLLFISAGGKFAEYDFR